MLELCFGDSVKGALRMAQHCGGNSAGAIGVILSSDKRGIGAFFEKRRELKRLRREHDERQKQAIPLGGRREDVLGLTFHLCEGDISAHIEQDCPRRVFLSELFSAYDEEPEDAKACADRSWESGRRDLQRLQQGGEVVRIWVDHTPEASCGLLFAADLLTGTDTEVRVVTLPKKHQLSETTYAEYRGWGEVHPEQFGAFLTEERVLSQAELDGLSRQWRALQAENAPLRVVEQDQVVSAAIDYYDDRIRRAFPKESCKVCELIGKAMADLPAGDVFVAKRIEHFLQTGELLPAGPKTPAFYQQLVQKGK